MLVDHSRSRIVLNQTRKRVKINDGSRFFWSIYDKTIFLWIVCHVGHFGLRKDEETN